MDTDSKKGFNKRSFSRSAQIVLVNIRHGAKFLPWTYILCFLGFLICLSALGKILEKNSEVSHKGGLSGKLRSFVVAAQKGEHDVAIQNISEEGSRILLQEVAATREAIRQLDKSVSNLELELAANRANKMKTRLTPKNTTNSHPSDSSTRRKKAFVVVGVNTAFSSKKRRDSVRETWMPQGEMLKKLEDEKGIVVRFVIGHSATPGGILDRAIEAENKVHNDFLRLEHVEGYLELSTKTKIFFATAVEIWDADFYVKVDDDIHVNLGTLAARLAKHKHKPMVYMGCMKSGPVLSKPSVKYFEPEFWKFGEEGNRYFRHATGQLYVISKALAIYVSINRDILHKYVNEDVSLGSWFIGLDVDYVDDRTMCCGTPPDCEWKAQASDICAASFDWPCSGICKSVERMKDVHERCGEGPDAVWNAII